MTDYPFPAPPQPVLPIVGSDQLFPLRRVYCVGRNYAAHAREMGHDPEREPPFFFQKNPDSLDTSGRFPYPVKTADVHHEVELLVALGAGGRDIAAGDALDAVFGYAIALDMTRRDLQGAAKKLGRPWEIGKAFESAAPTGPVYTSKQVGHPAAGRVALTVNGTLRQEGDLADMIWRVPEIIAYLSTYFTLAPGDVILTGTPAGVGPVVAGDRMRGEIAGLGALDVAVV